MEAIATESEWNKDMFDRIQEELVMIQEVVQDSDGKRDNQHLNDNNVTMEEGNNSHSNMFEGCNKE